MPAEFDKFSDKYEDLLKDPILDRFALSGHAFFFHRKLAVLLEYLTEWGLDPSKLSLLDLGCGKADFLKLSAPYFSRLAGCDLSEKMLNAAAAPASLDVRLQETPTEIPFETNEFDVLTAICVFHHVAPDARNALWKEIHRVLRPNGVVCLIEHNPFNPVTQIIVRRTPVDEDARLLTAALSKQLARRAGFVPDGLQYFLYLPELLYSRVAWIERALATFPLGGQYAMFCRKGEILAPAVTG